MGSVYTVKKVTSQHWGQLFPTTQAHPLDTRMKVQILMDMFEKAFLDLGASVSGENNEYFSASFGFAFGKNEEVSYAIGGGVDDSAAESWRRTLDRIQEGVFSGMRCEYDYDNYVRRLEFVVDGWSFKGYFERVYYDREDVMKDSIEMTNEVIREVERAIAKQPQPIAKIIHYDGEEDDEREAML